MAAAMGLACLLVLYRVQLATGFDRLSGDLLDTRIAIALQQHWVNVLAGREGWQEPLYFTPTTDVLGYNDGYVLFGLVYAGLRATGLDPFLANEAVGAVFRGLGYAGFFLFARLVARLPFWWAVLGAAVFTLSNAVAVQSTHMQLCSVALTPWLALLIWRAWHAATRRARVGWPVLVALLVSCWLMTGFYTVWFAGMFGLVFAIAALGCCRPKLRWPDWSAFLPAGLVLMAGLAVLVATYLPKARETGMHRFSEVLPFLPSVFDLTHVGPGNFLFGWFDQWVMRVRPIPPESFELAVGFAPPFLAMAAAAMAAPWFQARSAAVWWWRAAGLAVLVCLLLVLRVGQHSLWRLVFAVVPGAGAVRVVSRFLITLDFPLVLLVMNWLSRMSLRWPRWVVLALAALLVGEELNGGAAMVLDRPGQLAMLQAVPPPPAPCRRFFATAPRVVPDMFGQVRDDAIMINVDAMLVAEMVGLPTFNGHASFLPPNFGFSFHDLAQYSTAARSAVLASNLERGTCGLDLQTSRWVERAVVLAPLVLGIRAEMGGATPNGSAYVLSGWSGVEPAGRWTEGDVAEIGFAVDHVPGDLILTLQASALPGKDGKASAVRVLAGQKVLADWQPGIASQALVVRVPHDVIGPDGAVRLRLSIVRPTAPVEIGLSPDPRRLGLFVEHFRVDAAPP